MPVYNCEICFYSTKIKTHFNRHINTPKHNRKQMERSSLQNDKTKQASQTINCKIINSKDKDIKIKIPDSAAAAAAVLTATAAASTATAEKIQKPDKTTSFSCELCGRILSTKGHLARHVKTYCPEIKNKKENNILKDLLDEQKQQFANERAELYKQIEKLLDKVGNTTNIQSNIKNTIHLNNYGKEDLSHITASLKTQLVKIPYGMIPKLIEAVHFNDERPENKNIALTNSRDNKIKIFSDNKWIYKDKEQTINDLVDGKYYILDSHFDSVSEDLGSMGRTNYYNFKEYFNSEDKEFVNKLKRECELVLLNNR